MQPECRHVPPAGSRGGSILIGWGKPITLIDFFFSFHISIHFKMGNISRDVQCNNEGVYLASFDIVSILTILLRLYIRR